MALAALALVVFGAYDSYPFTKRPYIFINLIHTEIAKRISMNQTALPIKKNVHAKVYYVRNSVKLLK